MKREILAKFADGFVLFDDSSISQVLHDKSTFGTIKSGKHTVSYLEALFLVKHNKIKVRKSSKIFYTFDELLKRCKREEKNIELRYTVFENLRKRGYIVKTALKFGADFRVYDRGIKPGEDHAKWIVYVVKEGHALTWHEFSAKNRVAHSTKKKLMMAIVDDESDVSYYEIRWVRP